MVFNNQATVPSPPATSIVDRVFPSKRHHSRAATGSRSARSTTCAGFNNLLNRDKIWPPSLFPDFVFPEEESHEKKICLAITSFTYLEQYIYWAILLFPSLLPTTMIGFQLGQFGGMTERRCNLRLIVLRRFTVSKFPGGMIINLNFPKSHIWKSMHTFYNLFHFLATKRTMQPNTACTLKNIILLDHVEL